MAAFCLKLKMHELKIYRGVMCHDNEEWCKNWRGIDLSHRNWHDEFWEFWPITLNSQKFAGWFWAKYIMFEQKKYRQVMFDSTEYWCKIWTKTGYLCFQKWHEEFSNFLSEHVQKSKNWYFDGILSSKVGNVWA